MVREGLAIHRVVGNEYAQFVEIRLPSGSLCTVGNVYLPPTNNLGRRNLTEPLVRDKCMDILSRIHAESPLLLVGDFNARTGSCIPSLENFTHPPRVSSDSVTCPRGDWLIDLCELF